jgi:hypothetical protein
MEDSVMLFGENCANIEAMASVCNPLLKWTLAINIPWHPRATMMAAFLLQQGELRINAEIINKVWQMGEDRPRLTPQSVEYGLKNEESVRRVNDEGWGPEHGGRRDTWFTNFLAFAVTSELRENDRDLEEFGLRHR